MNIRKILSNLSVAFIAQLVALLGSVFMSLIVPKLLGVEEFAYWQLFIFYTTYVGLSHLGSSDGIYLRLGGQDYKNIDKPLLGGQLRILVAIQLIIVVVLLFLNRIFSADLSREIVVRYTMLYMLFANVTWYMGFIFQAVNQPKIYSATVILQQSVFWLAILVIIFFGQVIYQSFIVAYCFAMFISMVYIVLRGRDIVFVKSAPLKTAAKEFIVNVKVGINLTLSAVANTLMLGIGRYMIDAHWGIMMFGKISFSLQLCNFFLRFISQIGMVLFPVLKNVNQDDTPTLYLALNTVANACFPAILLLYTPVFYILNLWLPEYAESLRYLIILLPICIFDGKMTLISNTYLKAFRQEKLLFRINVLSLIISSVLSFLFTYVCESMEGVAAAMLFVIALRSIIADRALSKSMNVSFLKNEIILCLLVLTFVLTTWNAGILFGFILYSLLFLCYLLMRYKVFIESLRTIKVIFSK